MHWHQPLVLLWFLIPGCSAPDIPQRTGTSFPLGDADRDDTTTDRPPTQDLDAGTDAALDR